MYIILLIFFFLQNGNTPLHLAVSEGHNTCVELLSWADGIDVNIGNEVSWRTLL